MEAYLVTREGDKVLLSDEKYEQILKLIASQVEKKPTKAALRVLARELYGKYAGGASLAQELVEEHRKAREREVGRHV